MSPTPLGTSNPHDPDAYDVSWVARWPTWAASIAAWGAVEAVRPRRAAGAAHG